MNNTKLSQPKDRLRGINYLMELYDSSRSTIGRKIEAGEISPPDIPGGNGKPNKWFHSTIDRDFMNLKKLVEEK